MGLVIGLFAISAHAITCSAQYPQTEFQYNPACANYDISLMPIQLRQALANGAYGNDITPVGPIAGSDNTLFTVSNKGNCNLTIVPKLINGTQLPQFDVSGVDYINAVLTEAHNVPAYSFLLSEIYGWPVDPTVPRGQPDYQAYPTEPTNAALIHAFCGR